MISNGPGSYYCYEVIKDHPSSQMRERSEAKPQARRQQKYAAQRNFVHMYRKIHPKTKICTNLHLVSFETSKYNFPLHRKKSVLLSTSKTEQYSKETVITAELFGEVS